MKAAARCMRAARVYKLDKTLIEGLDAQDESVRRLDQSRVGAILTGEAEALKGGAAGQGDADPEHQSDGGRAQSGQGAGAASCARTCSSACTSSS